jgi:hypothetical protein
MINLNELLGIPTSLSVCRRRICVAAQQWLLPGVAVMVAEYWSFSDEDVLAAKHGLCADEWLCEVAKSFDSYAIVRFGIVPPIFNGDDLDNEDEASQVFCDFGETLLVADLNHHPEDSWGGRPFFDEAGWSRSTPSYRNLYNQVRWLPSHLDFCHSGDEQESS